MLSSRLRLIAALRSGVVGCESIVGYAACRSRLLASDAAGSFSGGHHQVDAMPRTEANAHHCRHASFLNLQSILANNRCMAGMEELGYQALH